MKRSQFKQAKTVTPLYGHDNTDSAYVVEDYMICPHTMTRYYQDSAPDSVWLAGMLALLGRCDAIYLLPGWESSSGSRAERDQAKKQNLPEFTDMPTLRAWLENPPPLFPRSTF